MIKQDTSKVQKYHVIDKKLTKCYQSNIETTQGMMKLLENKPISYYDGKFLLLAVPYNFIYQLDEKNISEKYFIDFGSSNFKESDASQGYRNILSLFQEGRRIGLLDHIFENKTLVSFTYATMPNGTGTEIPVIYSKTNNKTANFNEVLANSGLPVVELIQFRNSLCTFQIQSIRA